MMAASEDDPLIPVMLPTSVVAEINRQQWHQASDHLYAAVGVACREARPELRVALEVDRVVRDRIAAGAILMGDAEDVIEAARASRDAEVETR